MLEKVKFYALPVLVILGFIAYVGIALHFVGKATVELRKAIHLNLNVPLE